MIHPSGAHSARAQACSTWQCTMCDFSRLRPARLDQRLVTNDLNWPFPEIVSHNCPCLSGISAFFTSTRAMLILFLMMQSFPPKGTRATASIAREPPRWTLLSTDRLQASVSRSYIRNLHPSRQSKAYRLPWSSTHGLRQPETIPSIIGAQWFVAGTYTSLITCLWVPRPFKNHLQIWQLQIRYLASIIKELSYATCVNNKFQNVTHL